MEDADDISALNEKKGIFKINTNDSHLGVPLWYVLEIKNNQIRMMSERGYRKNTNDEVYKNLNNNNLQRYFKNITPETMKGHMSMVYTLKDKTQRTYRNKKNLGDNCLVFYPEFSLNKEQTKIKEESGDMVKEILSLLDLRSEGKDSNLVVYASEKVYGNVMREMGGTDIKKIGKWVFNTTNTVTSFLKTIRKNSYVKRIIIISYSGIRTVTKRSLEKNSEYYFEEFSYTDMSYVPIDHVYANRYTRLTTEEWENIKKDTPKTNINISKIYTTDAVNRYYGATINNVYKVEIRNMVPTSYISSKYIGVRYRIVVRDPLH